MIFEILMVRSNEKNDDLIVNKLAKTRWPSLLVFCLIFLYIWHRFSVIDYSFQETNCIAGPEIGVLGCHAPIFVQLSTILSKGTSLRQNTRFESSTIQIG